jgi:hypothetical protein
MFRKGTKISQQNKEVAYMDVKEFKNKLSKFPGNMPIYMSSNWAISARNYSGFVKLESIRLKVKVKLLKSGLLKESDKFKERAIVLESGDTALVVDNLLELLNKVPNNTFVTIPYIIVGPKLFIGLSQPDYEFKVSGVKRQEEVFMYDENTKGKNKVLLLKEKSK